MGTNTTLEPSVTGQRLCCGLIAGVGMSLIVVVSAWCSESAIGAPAVWPWLLTGLQVLSLWSAGRKLWWGWLLGGSVQIPWIAYAVLTSQIGFIPGCCVSAFVQLYSFGQRNRHTNHRTTTLEVAT